MKNQKMITKTIQEDQQEMCQAFLGGYAGQLVSGIIWLIASGVSVMLSEQIGMATLFFGCMMIFPLTQLTLKLMGRPAKVHKSNRLWQLGSQIAFTVPINFVLVGAIILFRPLWFFPAAMVIVGAHYLPFITLYGMKIYGVLAGVLIVLGLAIGLYGPEVFSLGGWITGIVLVVFSVIIRVLVHRSENKTTCSME